MIITAALILLVLFFLAVGLGRSWSDETQTERNALVFADRNREYGAYRLRTDYGKRMGVALLGAIGLFGVSVLVPSVIAHFNSVAGPQAPPPVVVDVDLGQLFVSPPEPPKPSTPRTATVAPPAKPDQQRYVQAVDSLVEPPELPKDTAGPGLAPGPGPGGPATGGGTGLLGTTGGGTGTGTDDGTAVWDGFEVQEVPQFPGGEAALGEWVRRHLVFPADVEGKDVVYVQFTVGLDGSVEDVHAVKGKQKSYKSAAERTVRRMPKWKPARMNGHEVRCRLTLPIRFETR
ncbi:MAG: energy transducer TonB [Flavobacteriales bacterium]|nr:energy transducer TonB [Flavobacteriales bacterium]